MHPCVGIYTLTCLEHNNFKVGLTPTHEFFLLYL